MKVYPLPLQSDGVADAESGVEHEQDSRGCTLPIQIPRERVSIVEMFTCVENTSDLITFKGQRRLDVVLCRFQVRCNVFLTPLRLATNTNSARRLFSSLLKVLGLNRVGPKYSRGPAVVSKETAEAFATADGTARCFLHRSREEHRVCFALMVAL